MRINSVDTPVFLLCVWKNKWYQSHRFSVCILQYHIFKTTHEKKFLQKFFIWKRWSHMRKTYHIAFRAKPSDCLTTEHGTWQRMRVWLRPKTQRHERRMFKELIGVVVKSTRVTHTRWPHVLRFNGAVIPIWEQLDVMSAFRHVNVSFVRLVESKIRRSSSLKVNDCGFRQDWGCW